LRPEVYLSYSYFILVLSLATILVGLIFAGAFGILGAVTLGPIGLTFLLVVPFVAAAALYLFIFLVPDLRAADRARAIDARLPHALNYLSTMASAGVPFDRILASLSQQAVYGEVADEVAWIARDVDLLGMDLVTALAHAIERSPSERMQDFLQGCIMALTSGSDLQNYLRNKAAQYAQQNRLSQKKFLESLGVLSESYVTVVAFVVTVRSITPER
jgi:flagellar protein FlaJ